MTTFQPAACNNFIKSAPVAAINLSLAGSRNHPEKILPFSRYGLLTAEARREILTGRLPDLSAVCRELFISLFPGRYLGTALPFIPVMKRMEKLTPVAAGKVERHPAGKMVLVQNDWLKVVLISWKPGDQTDVHGHPSGGCVFKVLQGKLQEKRYSPTESPVLKSVEVYQEDDLAYIDDRLAFHSVGNPNSGPAISLHAYTPGSR